MRTFLSDLRCQTRRRLLLFKLRQDLVHSRHAHAETRARSFANLLGAATAEAGRVPRVSRLMALAMRFDELIGSGQVTGYAELARLGHVSRARLSQIASLLGLAPPWAKLP